jgi:hypothetical protein
MLGPIDPRSLAWRRQHRTSGTPYPAVPAYRPFSFSINLFNIHFVPSITYSNACCRMTIAHSVRSIISCLCGWAASSGCGDAQGRARWHALFQMQTAMGPGRIRRNVYRNILDVPVALPSTRKRRDGRASSCV